MDLFRLPASGQCEVCGCTEDRGCEGGCIWANATATLCSQCAQHERPPLELLGDDDSELAFEL